MQETFQLEQDTPMWVFNPRDPGCGLRATEVKPKLDKYLAKKAKDAIKAAWIVQDKALDYKMSFEYDSYKLQFQSDNTGGRVTTPMFFANMGPAGRKEAMMFNGLRMLIYTRHKELMNVIKAHVADFFASHSFGTRQDKGYGCFHIKDKPINCKGASYYFEIHCTPKDFEKLFKNIEYFHKMLRSGINEKRRAYTLYGKSLMYFYAKSQNPPQIWDKVYLRHKLEAFNKVYEEYDPQYNPKYKEMLGRRPEVKKDVNSLDSSKKYYLFRDALGLSSNQRWKEYDDIVNVKSSSIDRFKSPLFYRPVMLQSGVYRVYIYTKDLPQGVMDAEFSFKSKKIEKQDKSGKGNGNRQSSANKKGAEVNNMKIYPALQNIKNYLEAVIENRETWLSITTDSNMPKDFIAKKIKTAIEQMFNSLIKNENENQ